MGSTVNLSKQRAGRHDPLGHQLKRELRSCPLSSFQPTRQLVQSLLARGQQERESLVTSGSGLQLHLTDIAVISDTGMEKQSGWYLKSVFLSESECCRSRPWSGGFCPDLVLVLPPPPGIL